jgi:hypothetical protein
MRSIDGGELADRAKYVRLRSERDEAAIRYEHACWLVGRDDGAAEVAGSIWMIITAPESAAVRFARLEALSASYCHPSEVFDPHDRGTGTDGTLDGVRVTP